MIKLLATIDAIASILLILLIFNIKIPILAALIAILLLLKSVPFLLFSFCLASFIDSLVALTLIVSNFFSLPILFIFIIFLLIGQKAFFSFF